MGRASMETAQVLCRDIDDRDWEVGRTALTSLYGAETDARLTRKPDSATEADSDRTENSVADTIHADCARSSVG